MQEQRERSVSMNEPAEKNAKTYTPSPTLAMFHEDESLVRAVAGPVGCVDADTEFLTPLGWRKINTWTALDEKIAVWEPDSNEVWFTSDYEFISLPCAWFNHFTDGAGGHIDMMLSDEHTVPLYAQGIGFHTLKARRLAEIIATKKERVPKNPAENAHLHDIVEGTAESNGFSSGSLVVPTKFSRPGAASNEVMDAVRAAKDLVGRRKAKRTNNAVPFRVSQPLVALLHYEMTSELASGVVDILFPHVDERVTRRAMGITYQNFATWSERDADLVQFACHLAGRRARVSREVAEIEEDGVVKRAIRFNVLASRVGHPRNEAVLNPAVTDVDGVHSPDGFKYCFTTPTGYFIARRNGFVFATGNSGKSVAMCIEIVARACQQKATKGVRKSRWAVIRNTYSMLETTTIKTFMDWLAPFGSIVWGSPITFTSKQPLGDGTRLDLEVLFFPMDREDDVKRLLSLELTGAWLNEAKELPLESLIDPLLGRIGRYPSKADGGASWSGIIMDTNMPSSRSHFYQIFEMRKPVGFRLFKQPPALLRGDKEGEYVPNPDAENVDNHELGFEYYMRQTRSASEAYIKTMILAEYGAVFDGQPVFNNFRPREHVAKTGVNLRPSRSSPLIVGMDFGLNPAAVLCQLTPHGSVQVFDELSPQDITLEQFIDEELIPLLNKSYQGYPILIVGDPAGGQRSALGQMNSFQTVRMRGLAATPAKTNDFILRRDAVDFFLRRAGGFVMSAECPMLFEALNGGYKYNASSTSGGRVVKERPDKNEFSHIADALQYACLHYYASVARPPRPAIADAPQRKVRFA